MRETGSAWIVWWLTRGDRWAGGSQMTGTGRNIWLRAEEWNVKKVLLVSCRWLSASLRAVCCSGPVPVLKRCMTWCWAVGRGSPTWDWTSRRSTACSRASPRPHLCTWTYWVDGPVLVYVLCVYVCKLGLQMWTSICVCLHIMTLGGEKEIKVVWLCECVCVQYMAVNCYCKCMSSFHQEKP